MKKNAFTLAEVLITLTIIGVVAALTLPGLNLSVQNSKVGPSLRKFINTISNANEMILAESQSNSLRTIYDAITNNNAATEYMTALAGHVRGAATAANATVRNYGSDQATNSITITNGVNPVQVNQFQVFNLDSGESMAIRLRRTVDEQQRGNLIGAHRGVFADVIYDIDGFNTGSNMLGTDLFVFRIDNNGSLIPAGGSAEASAGYVNIAHIGFHIAIVNGRAVRVADPPSNEQSLNTIKWSSGNDQCSSSSVGTGVNCAGSVADNNWRVIYQNVTKNSRRIINPINNNGFQKIDVTTKIDSLRR